MDDSHVQSVPPLLGVTIEPRQQQPLVQDVGTDFGQSLPRRVEYARMAGVIDDDDRIVGEYRPSVSDRATLRLGAVIAVLKEDLHLLREFVCRDTDERFFVAEVRISVPHDSARW